MAVTVFGVRHHGPGSARALVGALDALGPDVLLVEGPPDADAVIPWAGDAEMEPPVAILVRSDERAVMYPYASFSPEWQALRWALARGVPVRFADLPVAHRLALPDEPRSEDTDEASAWATLAAAAGVSDHEQWWERMVELRRDARGLFAAVGEAVRAVRAEAVRARPSDALVTVDPLAPENELEARREAWMRRAIRQAARAHVQVAVVCGAWHAPALEAPSSARADDALLAKLPKVKVEACWIPWTSERLAVRTGYGAGVRSPGWYAHLWESRDQVATRWIAKAARLLREAGHDVPSASVIDAVRVADALAAVRGLAMPGLDELTDAMRAVLGRGVEGPMALVRDRLEVGRELGAVPAGAPAVPLQQDVSRLQKTLRMKPEAETRPLALDLRKERDREKSQLLHRLRALGVDWGAPVEVSGKEGTFHEHWELRWRAEHAVALVEASAWGQTVEEAAGAVLIRRVGDAFLPALAELLDEALLAALPVAVEAALDAVQDRAARAGDVRHLMKALLPLARVARYGDVRGTPAERLRPVIDGLFERVVVGLPPAAGALDDDAAEELLTGMERVGEAVALLDRRELAAEWTEALVGLLDQEAVHGLIRGAATRRLLDAGALDDIALRASRALSAATPTPEAAAWVVGLLRGSGLLLLHQDALWAALDAWLSELEEERFREVLPLLRRAFSAFEPAERRAMGERLHRERAPAPPLPDLDPGRAARALPVLAALVGVRPA